MRTFIVRPFGIKQGINFDHVEEALIRPAMWELGLTGGPTMAIIRQGNIRADMFQRLLTADLVIADLSIHNVNVFYELGIRHALREKRTFLLRSRGADPSATTHDCFSRPTRQALRALQFLGYRHHPAKRLTRLFHILLVLEKRALSFCSETLQFCRIDDGEVTS